MTTKLRIFLASFMVVAAIVPALALAQNQGPSTSLTGGYNFGPYGGYSTTTQSVGYGPNYTYTGQSGPGSTPNNPVYFPSNSPYTATIPAGPASTPSNPVYCVLANGIENVGDIFRYATCQLSRYVMPFLISLASILFMVGVVRFIAARDDKGKTDGRSFMVWGIIALFVMVSVWGIVRIATNTFGFDFAVPQLQTYGQ